MARAGAIQREPRLANDARPLRRARSLLALVLTAIVVAVVLATLASVVVWGLSVAIHHASSS